MPTYQHLYMCKRLQSIPYCACFHTCCVSFKVGEESLPMYSNSYRNVIVWIDRRLKIRPRDVLSHQVYIKLRLLVSNAGIHLTLFFE